METPANPQPSDSSDSASELTAEQKAAAELAAAKAEQEAKEDERKRTARAWRDMWCWLHLEPGLEYKFQQDRYTGRVSYSNTLAMDLAKQYKSSMTVVHANSIKGIVAKTDSQYGKTTRTDHKQVVALLKRYSERFKETTGLHARYVNAVLEHELLEEKAAELAKSWQGQRERGNVVMVE